MKKTPDVVCWIALWIGCSLVGALSAYADVPLPADYSEIAYLEATGEQCIDTDYLHKPYDVFTLDVEPAAAQPDNAVLFGSRHDQYTSSKAVYFRSSLADATGAGFYRAGKNATDASLLMSGVRGTLTCDETTATWAPRNGSAGFSLEITGQTAHNEGVNPVAIFATSDSTEARGRFFVGQSKARLYSFRIASQDGTLRRDFVPCRNASGDAGLWDKVEGVFYGDANGGHFIAHEIPRPGLVLIFR